METVEQIKAQLAALTAKVNELGETKTVDYVFTEKEMIKFVSDLHEGFTTSLRHNMRHLDFEDAVELDLCDRNIEVSINNELVINTVVDSCDTDLDNNAILDTVAEIYRNIKA
jgi:hypothetical protein